MPESIFAAQDMNLGTLVVGKCHKSIYYILIYEAVQRNFSNCYQYGGLKKK